MSTRPIDSITRHKHKRSRDRLREKEKERQRWRERVDDDDEKKKLESERPCNGNLNEAQQNLLKYLTWTWRINSL